MTACAAANTRVWSSTRLQWFLTWATRGRLLFGRRSPITGAMRSFSRLPKASTSFRNATRAALITRRTSGDRGTHRQRQTPILIRLKLKRRGKSYPSRYSVRSILLSFCRTMAQSFAISMRACQRTTHGPDSSVITNAASLRVWTGGSRMISPSSALSVRVASVRLTLIASTRSSGHFKEQDSKP